jgi:hypothetical protein
MLFIGSAVLFSPPLRHQPQLPRHVAREHVDFNVHTLPSTKISKKRAAKRVRDEHDFEEDRRRAFAKTILDTVNRQTHPIDTNRTFVGKVRGQVPVQLHFETLRFAS